MLGKESFYFLFFNNDFFFRIVVTECVIYVIYCDILLVIVNNFEFGIRVFGYLFSFFGNRLENG